MGIAGGWRVAIRDRLTSASGTVRRRQERRFCRRARRWSAAPTCSPRDEEHRQRPRWREVDARDELYEEGWKEGPVPPEERDHRDHDSDVEHGVDDLERTPGEERQ